METEITLLSVFFISLVVIKFTRKEYDVALAGRIAMLAMLVLTTIAHFMFTEGMAMMLPDFVPFRTELIYLTGVLELMAAIGLLIPKYQVLTGWLLLVFFVMIFPSNIYAALNHVDLQEATYTSEEGPAYLFYRIPLQIVYIVWVYFSSIRNHQISKKSFL